MITPMRILFDAPRCPYCGKNFTPQEAYFARFGFACDDCYGQALDEQEKIWDQEENIAWFMYNFLRLNYEKMELIVENV